MADIREVFPILQNASNEGVVPSEAQAGQLATGKIGIAAFAFRDSLGALILPQLDVDGKLPVSTEAPGICVNATAEDAGSLTEVDLASISLTINKTYAAIEAVVSCTRAAKFKIVQINDLTTTTLATLLTGPGQFTVNFSQNCLEISAGASGTQTLKITGQNLDKAASMYSTLSALERA